MAQVIGGRYVISRLIGEGGMADVYLAMDAILNRQVAVKVLRGELNNDPVNLQRFQREAQAITHLSHPNIVEVYDVGEDQGRNYIVMEYVPGKTLKQMVKTRGALNAEEAVSIMKQLVSATAHAHKNGIIHRDIKSQNVLVKADGTVKLSDFGIAFTQGSQELTQTNTVMGSVHYLAPELAKGAPASPQSDIYALGIVFFEMLTGDVPFHGDTPVEIALKHLHQPVPSVRDFNADIPQPVENIIIRCTAKDPARRYNSADELYSDLVTCLDFSRSKEPKLILEPAEKANPKSGPIKVRRKKRSGLGTSAAALIAVAAISALAILAMLYLNGTIGPKVEKVAVPEVANSTVEDATALLQSSGFEIKGIQYEATEDTEKGLVIRTIPAADTRQAVGTAVTLVVSSGKNFTVSDYTGQNIHSIKALLEAQGVVVTTTEVANGNYPAGTIIEQDVPEGTVWGAGETRAIHFTVTSGVSFIVPLDLSGRPVGEAKSELEAMGAVVSLKALPAGDNISEAGSYLTEPETVVAVDPQEGTLYEQTAASTITLSYYPAADVSFTIPSGLVGQPVQEVKAQLEGLGARVKLTQLPAEENLDPETEEYLHKPGTVVSVTPAEGSFYVQGSSSAIELTYY